MAKTKKRDIVATTVPFAATPAGEPPSTAEWAHSAVWTERMLATLETGVKGGKNAYFAAHGLCSLSASHADLVQSLAGNY